MLTAKFKDRFIHINDLPIETLKQLAQEKQLHCVDCGDVLLVRECQQKQSHFSHQRLLCSSPFSEPESHEHETGKQALFRWLSSQYPEQVKIENHIPETNQRADLYISKPNFVVEYQCSPILAKTWEKRFSLYQSISLSNFWILGYSMHRYAQPNAIHSHRLNQLEQILLETYGKILYYDIFTSCFVLLYPEIMQKRTWIAKEYFLHPSEVFIDDSGFRTKYDYFIKKQSERFINSQTKTKQAKQSESLILQIKNQNPVKERKLATPKQIEYIKMLLSKTNKQIPYKFKSITKKEASELIDTLKKEAQ